jgi:uncharacterized protein YbjQ (UPF0145 family)
MKKMNDMLMTTTEQVPGKQVSEVLGIVKGSTVRTRNIGRDIGAGLKSIVGGEVKGYTEMSEQAREEALNRMYNQAKEMNADAVVGVRFSTTMIMQGASEMLAFGTAVKFK